MTIEDRSGRDSIHGLGNAPWNGRCILKRVPSSGRTHKTFVHEVHEVQDDTERKLFWCSKFTSIGSAHVCHYRGQYVEPNIQDRSREQFSRLSTTSPCMSTICHMVHSTHTDQKRLPVFVSQLYVRTIHIFHFRRAARLLVVDHCSSPSTRNACHCCQHHCGYGGRVSPALFRVIRTTGQENE